jgi:hypothetical protein
MLGHVDMTSKMGIYMDIWLDPSKDCIRSTKAWTADVLAATRRRKPLARFDAHSAEFFMDPVGISMWHDLLKYLWRGWRCRRNQTCCWKKHAAMHQMFTQNLGDVEKSPFSKVETCWNHQPDLMLNLDLKKWRIRKEDLGGNTSRRCHPARISAPGKLWQQWIGMEITSICQRSTVWCYSYPLVFKIALENMEITWKYPMFIGKSSINLYMWHFP